MKKQKVKLHSFLLGFGIINENGLSMAISLDELFDNYNYDYMSVIGEAVYLYGIEIKDSPICSIINGNVFAPRVNYSIQQKINISGKSQDKGNIGSVQLFVIGMLVTDKNNRNLVISLSDFRDKYQTDGVKSKGNSVEIDDINNRPISVIFENNIYRAWMRDVMQLKAATLGERLANKLKNVAVVEEKLVEVFEEKTEKPAMSEIRRYSVEGVIQKSADDPIRSNRNEGIIRDIKETSNQAMNKNEKVSCLELIENVMGAKGDIIRLRDDNYKSSSSVVGEKIFRETGNFERSRGEISFNKMNMNMEFVCWGKVDVKPVGFPAKQVDCYKIIKRSIIKGGRVNVEKIGVKLQDDKSSLLDGYNTVPRDSGVIEANLKGVPASLTAMELIPDDNLYNKMLTYMYSKMIVKYCRGCIKEHKENYKDYYIPTRGIFPKYLGLDSIYLNEMDNLGINIYTGEYTEKRENRKSRSNPVASIELEAEYSLNRLSVADINKCIDNWQTDVINESILEILEEIQMKHTAPTEGAQRKKFLEDYMESFKEAINNANKEIFNYGIYLLDKDFREAHLNQYWTIARNNKSGTIFKDRLGIGLILKVNGFDS